jgi:phage pi2 protein 07
MKILKHGIFSNANPNFPTIVTCPNCEAVLEVDRNDWTHFPNDKHCVPCPCCGFYIEHEPQENKTTQNHQKIVEEIIDYTDFEKIHKVMEALNWTWATTEGRVPTEEELKEQAKSLLFESLKKKCNVATGGFWIEYLAPDEDADEGINLSFSVENIGVFFDKDGVINYI